MKFNLSYVKKNPVMFGAIFVVFGLLVYLMLNKSADAGANVSYVSSGPSDAQVAGQVALGQASLAASASNYQAQASVAAIEAQMQAEIAYAAQQGATAVALGTMQTQLGLEELAVTRELGKESLAANLVATQSQLNTTLAMQQDNNKTMLDTIKVNSQLQAILGAQQAGAYQTSALVSNLGSLKKKDRDNLLRVITSGANAQNQLNYAGVGALAPTVQAA